MKKESLCIDVGTENCPCPLAETGDCIVCSRLQGKSRCDCNWQGVCIYNEYMQNGAKINNKRENFTVPVTAKKWYGEDLAVISLEVGKGFAMKAARPGSYVFLKAKEMPDWYNSPISVMKSEPEKGVIHLAMRVMSGKTKTIALQEQLEVRGVYRNGLLGLKENLVNEKGKILIVARGTGFAPGVLFCDWALGKWKTDFMIDLSKINEELVSDYINARHMEQIEYIDLNACMGSVEDKIATGEYDTVLVLASDYFIDKIKEIAAETGQKIICSNNFRMCCGEGICGACARIDSKGNCYKMCKCSNFDISEKVL